jgi:hypothetical protein
MGQATLPVFSLNRGLLARTDTGFAVSLMTPTSQRMALPCLGKSVFESRKVVTISLQPGNRNFDKNAGKILCGKRTVRTESHGKMNQIAISSRKLDKKMADE